MSPLRFLLLTRTVLLTFTLFLPAFGLPTPSTLRAEEPSLEQQRLDFEVQKLKLEVEELKNKPTGWDKIERLAPIIAPAVALLGFIGGAVWTIYRWLKERRLEMERQRQETERRRLETITNLKKEFASENPAIRIAAVHALADYPREAIPTLIASLGGHEPAKRGGDSAIEEDTAFTSAVKAAIQRIGEEAVNPLVEELRRMQKEMKDALIGDEKDERGVISLCYSLPFAVFNEFNKRPEAVRNKLKEVAEWNYIKLDDAKINRVVERLNNIRSSRPEAVIANKNGTEALSYLLRTHCVERLELSEIDLSGAYLPQVNLTGADLAWANLSGADLRGANLSGTHLAGANLSGARLEWAILTGANFGTPFYGGVNLSYADLMGANLDKVKFRVVADLRKANLHGVKGLSRDDLEYAKSKGAIIDEPATKPKEPAE